MAVYSRAAESLHEKRARIEPHCPVEVSIDKLG
jgi:hypothetical protein